MSGDVLGLYFSEIIIGAMLTVFGAFLRYWFQGVTKELDKILEKLDVLVGDFHDHKVDDAKQFGRLNADVNNIYKTMDRRNPRSIN